MSREWRASSALICLFCLFCLFCLRGVAWRGVAWRAVRGSMRVCLLEGVYTTTTTTLLSTCAAHSTHQGHLGHVQLHPSLRESAVLSQPEEQLSATHVIQHQVPACVSECRCIKRRKLSFRAWDRAANQGKSNGSGVSLTVYRPFGTRTVSSPGKGARVGQKERTPF